jgi:hypothetical protein
MIEVMRDQRIHTQISALRSSDPALSYDDARQRVADAEQREPSAWRPFQLAFILMQLPALTDPAAPARSGDRARVELLFFPTGGGKTEAYLGLAAYTFAIRRRHALVSSSDGPLDGRDGVGVLMRYTLRLLTAQQFQRGHHPGVRRRAGAPPRPGHLGERAVPDRAVGGNRRQPEALERGRGAAPAGQRAPADGAAGAALPVVRKPDRGPERAGGEGRPPGVRVVRR